MSISKGIIGTANDEEIAGTGQGEAILGNSGSDRIYGGGGDDILYGGEDNDNLHGEIGNDILDGGAGDDYLEGGSGDDTYIFGKGYGNDEIFNNSSASSDIDRLILKGLKLTDVRFEGNVDDDLIIRILETNETITVANYFRGGSYALEKIYFEEDKALSFEDVKQMNILVEGSENNDNMAVGIGGSNVTVNGGVGDDILTGTTVGNYNIYGGAGNDIITGDRGLDKLYGEFGDDIIKGNGGDDTLSGGAGADILYGGEDNDYLYGDAGDDTLYGERGDDYLDGGAGNDYLEGGNGNDTYVFGKGYGDAYINNSSSASSDVDELILKGLNLKDVRFEATIDNDLVVKILETNEAVTIKNYFTGGSYALEKICFEDGKVFSPEDVRTQEISVCGTAGKDSIPTNVEGSNVLVFGYRGDDVLIGRTAGKYTIYGGMGNDMIQGGRGNDTLYGEEGNDIIRGGEGDDCIHGGEGDDLVYGDAGDDVLHGCGGNDYLEGGNGNDTYVFGKGDGNDIINNNTSVPTDVDRLLLKGLDLADVWFEGSANNDLIIKILETDETVTVMNHFSGGSFALEKICFGDGMTLVDTQIKQLVDTMSSFTEDKPMSWNTLVDTEKNNAVAAVNQFWVAPTNI